MKRNSTKAIVQFVFPTAAVMLIQITNAQIVYTDVAPDVTTSGTYSLDLNNDGIIDFVIAHGSKSVKGSGKCKGQTATNQYFNVTPYNNNQVLDAGTNARRMPANQAIDPNVTSWGSNIDQVMFSSEFSCVYYCYYSCGYYYWQTNKGEWYPNNEDGYIGLRLISGGQTYYGWVRINISSDRSTFIVKDYAYNSTVDQPILAGQSSSEYLEISTIISGTPAIDFCAGSNVIVPYIIGGTFSASNVVTAELSDATGSFANPVPIGNVVSNISGNINAEIPALTPPGTAYRIRVTSSNPARTSSPNSYNLTISGGALPSGTIAAATYSSTNLCDGNVSLVSYAYPGNCNSYQWKLNGNDISGATTSIYNPTAAGDYTCTVTNGVGSVTSNVITVTANQIPATIQAYPGPTVCGEAISLTNTGMTGGYQWKQNGNDILGATESSYYPAVSGNYSCIVTNTCGNSISNIISVSISPTMADAVITATGPTVICNGTVVLKANTGSGLSYQWYDVNYPYSTYNPKIIPGATSSSYAASVTGVYNVIETNGAGCSGTSNYIVTLIGNPHPTIYPSSVTVCQGSPVNLYVEPSDYVIPPGVSYSYQWIKDGVDISNATTQNYTAKKPGTYTVRVTLTSGGCSGTAADVQITSCSNSNTIATGNSIQKEISALTGDLDRLLIAPNPVWSSAKISFKLKDPGKVLLAIYDISGRLFKTIADKKFDEGIHELNFDTNNMNPGFYLLRMESKGILQTRKFIVMK